MKKIINLTLIAMTFAFTSNVNAKQIQTSSATKAELKNIIETSKDLLNPEITPAAKKEITQEVLQDLETLGLTDYAKLLVERKKIAEELEVARAERDTFQTGWLWNSAEWHEADKKVGHINTKLRNKNREIMAMEKQQSKEQTSTVKYVVAGVVGTIGVIAALEYYFYPEGYMRTFFGRKTMPAREIPTITPPTIEPVGVAEPLPAAELTPIEQMPTKPMTQAEINRTAALEKLEAAKERSRARSARELRRGRLQ